MKMSFNVFLLFLFLILFCHSFGEIIYLSTNGTDSSTCGSSLSNACATFQKAFEISKNGDTIEVQPGTYFGPKSENLIVNASVQIMSTTPNDYSRTIIDFQNSTFGFIFQNNVSIQGFTFQSGSSFALYFSSQATLTNCRFISFITGNRQVSLISFQNPDSSVPSSMNGVIIEQSQIPSGYAVNVSCYLQISDSTFSDIRALVVLNFLVPSNIGSRTYTIFSTTIYLTLGGIPVYIIAPNQNSVNFHFHAAIVRRNNYLQSSNSFGWIYAQNINSLIVTSSIISENYGGVFSLNNISNFYSLSTNYTSNNSPQPGSVFSYDGMNIPSVIFDTCVFKTNMGSAISANIPLIFQSCIFTQNNNNDGKGSVIYAKNNFNLSLTILIQNSQMNGNNARDGGCIYVSDHNITLQFVNSVFTNNYASNGGVVYLTGSVPLTNVLNVNGSQITDNYGTNQGGALYCDQQIFNVILNESSPSDISNNHLGSANSRTLNNVYCNNCDFQGKIATLQDSYCQQNVDYSFLWIILAVIFGLIVVIIVLVFIIRCIRKRKLRLSGLDYVKYREIDS